MSNPGDEDTTPIASVRQLADYLAQGCKPREAWRIGTEHEKFGFRHSDFAPPPYEPDGIRAMLEGIAARGWEVIEDRGLPIGLKRGGASVSLEPGGQFELSGAPLASLHETAAELAAHIEDVRAVGEALGLGFAPLGFHPTARREDIPVMPKSRYGIMRRYMQTTGKLGLDMMLRTCTVQVNLDFGTEADMVRKLRVSLALQPVATALFANSPFTEGKPNGFLSARSNVWTDTDPDRTGIPQCVFEPGFGFERYVEWMLDVPMYFIARNGVLHDVAGASFRDFIAGRMTGRLAACEGEHATVGDFADHLTTAFPEVRLKRFLEMRGADAGSPAMMLAQSALWTGLLYDDAALAAAESLITGLDWSDFVTLRADVPRQGLDATLGGRRLRAVAVDMVKIAASGLAARGLAGPDGRDERALLDPVVAITEGGPTQAEAWLAHYFGPWRQDVMQIFGESKI